MCKILCFKKQQKQAEAEIVPSSSLVEAEVEVKVEVGVEVGIVVGVGVEVQSRWC